ncbi:hypothetical protein [Methanobrevibacter smithii]|uniref:hypothetical protein n=1 Tax=Methanobrevibacter smithii TaxID=2173 RepID=UPI0037DD6242
MIMYKRKITLEDVANLDDGEELIYYKTDNIAITINQSNDRYIVRKKQIADNDLMDEVFLKTVDEVIDFIEN